MSSSAELTREDFNSSSADRAATANAIAAYSANELLREGRQITIRALRPEDRAELVAAVEHTSDETLYRRFFQVKRHFTEKEIAYFVDVDFVKHVVLVATIEDGGRTGIVGGGRYVHTDPGIAELAFMVIDQFQGQGIGPILLRHLISLARNAGLKVLTADVLPDNLPMLKIFERSGLRMTTEKNSDEVRVVLQLL